MTLKSVGNGVPSGEGWKEIDSKDEKNSRIKNFLKDALVDEKGRHTTNPKKVKYEVRDVKLRERGGWERVGRGVAGIFASLPLVTLLFKPVRDLFTSKEELVIFVEKLNEQKIAELKSKVSQTSTDSSQNASTIQDLAKEKGIQPPHTRNVYAGVFFNDPRNTLPFDEFLKYLLEQDENGDPRILQLNKVEDIEFFLAKTQALKISDKSYLPALLKKWATEPKIIKLILEIDPELEKMDADAGINSPLAQAIIRAEDIKKSRVFALWDGIRSDLKRSPKDPVPYNDAELWLLKATRNRVMDQKAEDKFYTQENFQKLESDVKAAILEVAEKNKDTPSGQALLAQLHRFNAPLRRIL